MAQGSTIVSNIVWAFAERIIAQIVAFAVSVVLARLLMPEDFGIVAIVTVFISFCDALVNGGFANALVQKKDPNQLDFSSICWTSFVIAGFLYTLLFFCAPQLENFYEIDDLSTVVRVMGLRLFISAYQSMQTAYVQKKLMFRKFFYASFSGTILSAIIGILLAYKDFGVWALVWQQLAAGFFCTLILSLVIKWHPSFGFSFTSIKQLWSYGWKILVSTITNVLNDNIRGMTVGKVFTPADLAFYEQGKRFPVLLTSDITDSIGKVVFPVMSNMQHDKDSIKTLLRRAIRVSSFLLIPLIVGLVSISNNFILLLFTEKWMPCVVYLCILSLVYLSRPLCALFQKCVWAIGKSGITLFHEIVTTILSISLLLIALFVFHSMLMVAWGAVITTVVGLMIYAFYVKRFFNYPYYEMLKDYMPSLLLSLVMGLIVFFVGETNLLNKILTLTFQIIIGSIVYISFARVLRMKELKEVEEMIRPYIKNKIVRK